MGHGAVDHPLVAAAGGTPQPQGSRDAPDASPAGRGAYGPVGPLPGLAPAAAEIVVDLHGRFPLDLWMVTHVRGDEQTVVASAGPWAGLAFPGVVLPWARSFCRQMVAAGTPIAEPDVSRTPAFARIAVGDRAHVRAYLGAPLLSHDGELFGSLCGMAGTPQTVELSRSVLPPVQLYGQLLSSLVASEQVAAERSLAVVRAQALAATDQLTGLGNRHSWEGALEAEEQRARRYGCAASVLPLDLYDLKQINDRAGHAAGDAALVTCAQVLRDTCRPGDRLVRLGGDEFAVLAVECDAVSALALRVRLQIALREAQLAVSIGQATRRPGETLQATWQRADRKLYQDKRHRGRHTTAALEDESDQPPGRLVPGRTPRRPVQRR